MAQEMIPDKTPENIPDKPAGLVSRGRLAALARRVGPSLDRLEKRPALVWVLSSLFVLGLGLFVILSVLSAVVHARREILVPDLTGKTVEQALDAMSSLQLSLAKESVEFDESFPPGAIIRQSPPPGLKVREGKVIRVTLSSGGQVVFVPDLTNKPLPEAQNQMRAGGLILGALTEAHSERHEAGWVMEQSPAPGAVINRGQMVDLRVSKGRPPEGTLLMPDFANQPLTRALEWAQGKGLRADVREELRPDLLPGLVVSQAPAFDSLVEPGSALSFVVSRSTLTMANAQVVRYEVPEGSDRVLVRLVVRDERGEREIFQGYQDPGSLVEVPVVVRGASRARIFVNGVLIEERLLE